MSISTETKKELTDEERIKILWGSSYRMSEAWIKNAATIGNQQQRSNQINIILDACLITTGKMLANAVMEQGADLEKTLKDFIGVIHSTAGEMIGDIKNGKCKRVDFKENEKNIKLN